MLVHIVMYNPWYNEKGKVVCAFAAPMDAHKYAETQNKRNQEVYWVVSVPLTPEG